jgi:hypothetical protein
MRGCVLIGVGMGVGGKGRAKKLPSSTMLPKKEINGSIKKEERQCLKKK